MGAHCSVGVRQCCDTARPVPGDAQGCLAQLGSKISRDASRSVVAYGKMRSSPGGEGEVHAGRRYPDVCPCASREPACRVAGANASHEALQRRH